MRIVEYLGVVRTSMATIESIENPYGDYYVVRMNPKEGLAWRPGEHAIYTLPGKRIEGKGWRPFSVASAPADGVLMIGTRTGEQMSGFKKVLLSMEKGEKVRVHGPYGQFRLRNKTEPLVLIAGGVGITPMRAILKHLEHDKEQQRILIYTARDYHLFGEEIESWAKDNPAFDLRMLSSSKEAKAQVAELAQEYGAAARYFVSGSPKFVPATQELIMDQGVPGRRVIFDPLIGF